MGLVSPKRAAVAPRMACRKRLFSPHGNAQCLKGIELGLIAQAELVLQHGPTNVAVPVCLGVVEVGGQTFFPNRLAIARRRS